MLDESTPTTSSSSTTSDDGLPRPPRGRRAASRPAGPPEVLAGPPPSSHPALDTTAQRRGEIAADTSHAPKGELLAGSTDSEPAQVPLPQAVEPADDAPADETVVETPAQALPAPADSEPDGDEPVAAVTDAELPSAEQDAEPAEEAGPEESTAEQDDPVAAAIAAVMREVGPKKTRSRRAPKASGKVSAQTEAASEGKPQETAESETPEASEGSRPRRRRGSRRRAEPAATEEATQTTDTDDVDSALAAAEKSAEARGRRRRKSAKTDSEETTGEAEKPADKDAVLESLVAAIAGEEAPVPDKGQETSQEKPQDRAQDKDADEEPAEDDSDSESESDDGESTPHRRRRRRGGRRRRRGSDSAEEDSEESQSDSDSESEAKEDSEAGDQGENSEGSGSQHRRRRRRRRHNDEGSDDEGSDSVVSRIHESGHNLADEVTGIEGSTRLEAKRQRRKQGRAAGRRRAPILSEAEFLARRESVDRKMVIRQRDDYTQLAVLEDGVLVEHYVDRKASASLIGNIYLGKVQNVLPSMEAAFIDIGRGRNAVLYAGEVNWDAMENPSGPHTIQSALSSGQTLLVQVTKDPIGAKGARLTAHISLPGRFVVYSPDGHLSGISRKLSDSERHRLKGIVNETVDESASVIVRTAAEGADEESLRQDVDRLKAQWEVIQKKVAQGNAPQQLYAEPDLTLRIVRDLFTEDFGELVVAGNGGPEDAFETIDGYVEHVAGSLRDRLHRWDPEKGDPFAEFRIDEQISKALERKVFLPSGGSLVIDRTEAMNVIDVNTGKFIGSGGNLEETVTKNNLEAAEEIVRQMRLRDLGGIIVVDFIDMVLPANRELLLRRLVECLGRDRTRHQVSEVTSLGLVQMTRKRIGTGLAEAFTEECEACGGRGYVRHDEPVKSQAPADGGDRHHKGSHRSHSGK